MILSLTTDKISLITSETCDVDVVTIYTDRNQSTGAIGEANRQLTTIATGTTTDIVAAPGASTTRKISEITIRNAHASTSVDIIIQFDANGTLYEMYSARLYPKESCSYEIDEGWEKQYRNSGQIRTFRIYDEKQAYVQSIAVDGDFRGSAIPDFTVLSFKDSYIISNVGAFTWFDYTSAVTTTGIGIMIRATDFNGGQQSTIGVSTNHVATATLNTTNNNALNLQVAPCGTSAGATHAGGFLATGLFHSSLVFRKFDNRMWFGKIASEVAGSQVVLEYAWMDLFEHTG